MIFFKSVAELKARKDLLKERMKPSSIKQRAHSKFGQTLKYREKSEHKNTLSFIKRGE